MTTKRYQDAIDSVSKEVAFQTSVSEEVLKQKLDALNPLLARQLPFEDIIKLSSKELEYAVEEFGCDYKLIPGIATSARVRPDVDDNYVEVNINLGKMGNIGYENEEDITYDSMIDLSSNTKIFVAAIMYQLIETGLVNPYDTVKKYAPELSFLPDDLIIMDVIMFLLTLTTPERVDDATSMEDAINRFNKVSVKDGTRGVHFYSDMPTYVLQRIIENVTKKPFSKSVDERIIQHMGLERTALGGQVPENLMQYLTGSRNIYKQTPNGLIAKGLPNDPKACALGGFFAGAGAFQNTSDAMKVFEFVIDGKLFKTNLSDFYTPNPSKYNRAIAGQAIIPCKYNEYDKNTPDISPIISTGGQGSTRTIVTAGIYNINGIKYVISDAALTNAASANIDDILREGEKADRKAAEAALRKENEKRRASGEEELPFKFNFNPENHFRHYDNLDIDRIDVRAIASAYCLDNIAHALSNLKLLVSAAYAIRKKTESTDGPVLTRPFVMSKHL